MRQLLVLVLLAVFTFAFANEVTPKTPVCGPCQVGVNMIKDYLSQPDEELLKVLLNGCAMLPDQLQQPCRMAVVMLGSEVLKFARSTVSGPAKEVCGKLGLCRGTFAVQAVKQDSPLCPGCILGATQLKNFLKLPDEELLKLVNQVCSFLPSQYRQVCVDAISGYGAEVIKALRSIFDGKEPRQICAGLGVCTSSQKLALPTAEINKLTVALKQDGRFCTPCLMAVQLIKDYLDKPDDELIEMLAQACSLLPDGLQTPCKAMIAVIGKQLIAYVRSHASDSPRAICARWSMCSANIEATKQDGVFCTPCLMAVQLIKDYLDKPDNELIQMLAEACNLLPDGLQTPCKAMIAVVGKQLIDYVRSHVNDSPRKICAAYSMCGAASVDVILQDGFLCAPCQLGVQLVKDYLDKPDSELLKMLMSYCDQLPDQLITPCKLAVTMVGPQMIAYVRSHVNDTPRAICAKFRFCSASQKEVHPFVAAGKIMTQQLNLVECVKKCLSSWNFAKIYQLIQKCKRDQECYKREVGEAYTCVKQCF
jgi:hypothetical protein